MAKRKTPKKPIGQRIKDERRRRGWTQEKLARVLRVSIKTVSEWERGIALPGMPSRVKLATKLGVG